MLQTKSVPRKLPNWVQLKIYSERITYQKNLDVALNGGYLNGKLSLKIWIDYIQSLWRTEEEMAKKRPKKPKIVKNRSFSLFI